MFKQFKCFVDVKKMKLAIGQRLWFSHDGFVTITDVTSHYILVEYKGKIHRRPQSIIGEKLFLTQDLGNTVDKSEKKYSCSDCKLYRRDDCFGQKKICEDFKLSPNISENETRNWPKYGDATYYRMTSNKYRK